MTSAVAPTSQTVPASRGRPGLPNLVIAGVTKAGTTALFNHLVQHPDIGGERFKEWQYFAPLRFDHQAVLPGLETYRAQFAHCADHRVRLESSPAYFTGGTALVSRVREVLGAPRVLVSLRDPVERVWSGYRMKVAVGQLPPGSFRTFVDEAVRAHEAGARESGPDDPYRTVHTGMYANFLPDWTGVFGPDCRVVFFEHWRSEPLGVLGDLVRWLGLSARPLDEVVLADHNAGVLHRRPWLRRAAEVANRRGVLALRGRPAVKRRLSRWYGRLNTVEIGESFPADVRARLEEVYAPANARLAAQLRELGHTRVPPWVAARQ